MRALGVLSGLAATAITVLGSLSGAAAAHASNFGIELNGTWRVMSDGEWARTNDVKIEQKTVLQTWTITSSCVSPIECTGEVTSDQGWSAPLRLAPDWWIVDRVVPNWVPCANGTFVNGFQKFLFWGINPVLNERELKITDLMAGRDRTTGPSGACGVNKPVVIELPLRLERIS